jgi:hypothetical protein
MFKRDRTGVRAKIVFWVAASVFAATCAAGLNPATAGTPPLPPPIRTSTPTVQDGVGAAVAYANAHGVRAGIAVEDLKTGQTWSAGDTGTFGTGSVVKVMIATRLLLDGQMHGTIAADAYEMIIGSNDDDADYLWGVVGGPAIEPFIAEHYHIPDLGGPNIRPGFWGNTPVTAKGMATFYYDVSHDSKVWPWLSNAMAHAKEYADDGTDQYFGIPSAGAGHTIKQGWSTASSDDGYSDNATLNTTGIVDGRYAVVILGEGHDDDQYADSRGVEPRLAAVVTEEAQILLPDGHVSADISARNPKLNVDLVQSARFYVQVNGWAFDPDATRSELTVCLNMDNSRARSCTPTNIERLDVDFVYGLHEQHGFIIATHPHSGDHTYTLTAYNVFDGTADTSVSGTFFVTG